MTLILSLLAGAPLVINEVCYDPPGPDDGAEFVELYNPGPAAVSLAGCRLEFANGAGALAWELRWAADAGDSLAARACFLVADAGWTGPPAAAQTALDLQNGPDALRLVRADGSADVVGWGELSSPELYEGAPAPDVSGVALARRPDGTDTQNNASDLVAAAPTAGALNWPDFAPRLESIAWQPPAAAAAGATIRGSVVLRNAGRRDLAGSRLRLDLGGAVSDASLGAAPPESTVVAELVVAAPRDGRLAASLSIWGEVAAETLRWDLGGFQVGPAGMRIAEVMAAPAAGGEWCEIVNADVVPRNLADLSLRDEDGAWRSLPDLVLAPGDCRLLAQDPAALADWLAELAAAGVALSCDPAPPLAVGGWPSLNNTAPPSRDFADRLYLADTSGTVIDFVTLGLGSGRSPEARSLERSAGGGHWRPATAPAGATPGCPPPAAPDMGDSRVLLVPNPFSRLAGDGAVHAHLVVPEGAVGYELRIFDLWGRVVRDLGGDDLGPGPREAVWDGCDESGQALPAGGYVVVALWRATQGTTAVASRRLVIIRDDAR